ncbi:MAG: hypothetical protein AB7T07_08205 [Steroidobacteraceae bacterium]
MRTQSAMSGRGIRSATVLLIGSVIILLAPLASNLAVANGGSWGINAHTLYRAPALKSIGAQWVRVELQWKLVEASGKGRYNWTVADKTITHYLNNGMHIVCILSVEQLNPLYADAAQDKVAISAAIARWMGATAAHFAGKNIVWEIGNEPEVFPMGGYWNDAVTYTMMAKLSAKAIKQADPAAKVAALSLAWMDRAYATAALNAGLLSEGTIDYLSFHGYHRRTIEPESGLAEDIEWLRTKASQATPTGLKIPEVIDTETGYSLAAFESPKGINDWRTIVYSEEAQAAYLARHFVEEMSLGIPISIWYKDMNGEKGFSLYYGDETSVKGLRPMGRAFRTLSTLLPDSPAALKNDRYPVSSELIAGALTGKATMPVTPAVISRSFLRRNPSNQQELVIFIWNTVEAFDGKLLVSRNFSSEQCFETWRDISSSDPVSIQSKVSITGLGPSAVQSIRAMSLPDGKPETAPQLDSSSNTFKSELTISATPVPKIILITLRPSPTAPPAFRVTR